MRALQVTGWLWDLILYHSFQSCWYSFCPWTNEFVLLPDCCTYYLSTWLAILLDPVWLLIIWVPTLMIPSQRCPPLLSKLPLPHTLQSHVIILLYYFLLNIYYLNILFLFYLFIYGIITMKGAVSSFGRSSKWDRTPKTLDDRGSKWPCQISELISQKPDFPEEQDGVRKHVRIRNTKQTWLVFFFFLFFFALLLHIISWSWPNR